MLYSHPIVSSVFYYFLYQPHTDYHYYLQQLQMDYQTLQVQNHVYLIDVTFPSGCIFCILSFPRISHIQIIFTIYSNSKWYYKTLLIAEPVTSYNCYIPIRLYLLYSIFPVSATYRLSLLSTATPNGL